MSSETLYERYELKFLIPNSMREPIIDYIQAFCIEDEYSKKSNTNKYTINSLYLDSPNNLFFRRKSEGIGNRFNMRIRSYGENPGAPYFFEVKKKVGDFVRKSRGKIFHELTEKNFFSSILDSTEVKDPHLMAFLNLALSFNVEPKVLTRYERQAFMSTVDDYARITFDTNLQFHSESRFRLKPHHPKLSNYDEESLFPPHCDTILELKCNSQVPAWFLELIRHFELTRTGFSKFHSSFGKILQRENDMGFNRAGAI